jgi:hypothetical protein
MHPKQPCSVPRKCVRIRARSHAFWRFIYYATLLALAVGGADRSAWAQAESKPPETIADQLSTEERLRKPGWWPTKGSFPRDQFLGSAACAQCHFAIAKTQRESEMAQTATLAAKSEILKNHSLDHKLGPYSYRAEVHADGATYAVSDAARSISGPLTWTFGIMMGQSYFFDYNNHTYLVPLSFYPGTRAFGFTVDQPHSVPESLEKALGRPLTDEQILGCFNCHTTAATTDGHFDPQHSMPGVGCEACHGPGKSHVAAAITGFAGDGEKHILNPRTFKAVDLIDFCGACHRTWWDVTLGGLTGPRSLRFQPYRIENSRCWGKGDARLACIACHDPHRPLTGETSSYDQHCLACHVNGTDAKPTADHPGEPCKVARNDCAKCHMPQSEVIDIPVRFTDHQIRVVP